MKTISNEKLPVPEPSIFIYLFISFIHISILFTTNLCQGIQRSTDKIIAFIKFPFSWKEDTQQVNIV